MGDTGDLLLPEGTRLVHVGPHKTGTTAVQWAFHTSREAIAEFGVQYAGRTSQPYRAAVGLVGGRGRLGAPEGSIEDWERLATEVAAAGEQRVVLSSETFSNADVPAIERLAHDLGRERVHAVRMVRRYDKILPSQWQQSVAGGSVRTYEDWLEAVFLGDPHTFWHRHGYGELTGRWAEVLGPENVTVVVVDETDPNFLLRTFEQFLGLVPGTLPLPEGHANRSLTLGESEILRLLNETMRSRHWVPRAHHRFIRRSVTPALKRTEPGALDHRVVTPTWARERAAKAAEKGVRAIEDLGVNVVGDLSTLCQMPEPASVEPPDPDAAVLLPDSAAAALEAAVRMALKNPLEVVRGDQAPLGPGGPGTPVSDVTARELLATVAGRARRRASKRVRRSLRL